MTADGHSISDRHATAASRRSHAPPTLRPTLLAWGLLLTLLGCGPGGLRLHTPALWRSGTTGTHPVTGTAKISLALAEGVALEQPLEAR